MKRSRRELEAPEGEGGEGDGIAKRKARYDDRVARYKKLISETQVATGLEMEPFVAAEPIVKRRKVEKKKEAVPKKKVEVAARERPPKAPAKAKKVKKAVQAPAAIDTQLRYYYPNQEDLLSYSDILLLEESIFSHPVHVFKHPMKPSHPFQFLPQNGFRSSAFLASKDQEQRISEFHNYIYEIPI